MSKADLRRKAEELAYNYLSAKNDTWRIFAIVSLRANLFRDLGGFGGNPRRLRKAGLK